jgi:spore coat protein U-like protein
VKAFLSLLLFGTLSAGAGFTHAALTCAVSGTSLNFGTYNDASASTSDVSVPLSISCCRNPPGNTATLTIALGTSTNSTAGNKITTRQMKNGVNTDRMTYQLYSGSFGGTVWGDGAIGGTLFSQAINVTTNCPTRTTVPLSSAVFGRIFAQQAVSAGSYADTVTITVNP